MLSFSLPLCFTFRCSSGHDWNEQNWRAGIRVVGWSYTQGTGILRKAVMAGQVHQSWLLGWSFCRWRSQSRTRIISAGALVSRVEPLPISSTLNHASILTATEAPVILGPAEKGRKQGRTREEAYSCRNLRSGEFGETVRVHQPGCNLYRSLSVSQDWCVCVRVICSLENLSAPLNNIPLQWVLIL